VSKCIRNGQSSASEVTSSSGDLQNRTEPSHHCYGLLSWKFGVDEGVARRPSGAGTIVVVTTGVSEVSRTGSAITPHLCCVTLSKADAVILYLDIDRT
jgi:hypothetical protein